MKQRLKKIIFSAMATICLTFTALVSSLPCYAVSPTYNASAEYKGGKYYENLRAIELVGDGARDTLSIALSQLGYHEGFDNSGLDGMSTDGNRDFVEYNVLYGKLDNYQGNGLSYGYYWCASFVNWCLRQAEVTKAESAAAEVSCHRWLSACRNAGIYNEKEGYIPKSADLIFFKDMDSLVSSSHIGLVLYSDGERVYTIEGNTSNGSELSTNGNYVALKSYPLTSSYIVGYATPDYKVAENIGEIDYSGATLTEGKYISTEDMTVYSDATLRSVRGEIEVYTVFEVERVDGELLYLKDGGCAKAQSAKQIGTDCDIRSLSYIGITGKRIYASQYASVGTEITLTEDIPERSAAAFLGWEMKGSNTLLLPGDTVVLNDSVELLAIYEDTYRPSTEQTEVEVTEAATESADTDTTEELTELISVEDTLEDTSTEEPSESESMTKSTPAYSGIPINFGCYSSIGAEYGVVAIALLAISGLLRRKRV